MAAVQHASERAQQRGGTRLDSLTALQVTEHAHLTEDGLRLALRNTVPSALAARAALPAEVRAAPFDPELPGESVWTVGYLFDVIHTRDPWMHRVDIARATGRELTLSADHDGRIVADVVSDWARRHGKPFSLTLTGEAGGKYGTGDGGPERTLDAVEFCRILSGRASGDGVLATPVPF